MSSATVYMRPLFVISLNKALDYVNGFQNSMIHKFHVSIPEDNEYNKKVYISTKKKLKKIYFPILTRKFWKNKQFIDKVLIQS